MNEQSVLNRLKQLDRRQASLAGLINAKIVSIKQDRQCNYCKKYLKKSSRVVTASYLFDKKYNIDYTSYYKERLYKQGINVKFIPIRQWICLNCAVNLINEVSTIKSNNIQEWFKVNTNNKDTLYKELNTAYETGQISAKEYQDIENSIIHEESIIEAYRNEY